MPEDIAQTLPPAVELSEVPFYPQGDRQCGPASLAMVLRSSGLEVTPQDLSPMVYTPGRGGSMPQDMIGAARRYNRIPYPIHRLEAILREVAAGNPVIVLQDLGLPGFSLWHYAVVVGYDLSEETLVLRSGNSPRLIMSFTHFYQTWEAWNFWAIVVMPPDRLPATARPEEYLQAVNGLRQAGQTEGVARAYTAARQRWPGDPRFAQPPPAEP